MRIGLFTALVVSLMGHRSLVAQGCESLPRDSAEVQGVAEGIVAADNARDLERVLSYYGADAVLHPPGEPPVVGRDLIRPRYESLFGSYDPEIVPEIDEVSVCGRLGVVAGRNGGTLRGRTGIVDRELHDVFVMVLRRSDGVWRISRLIWHSEQR